MDEVASAHDVLWGNVQALREALRIAADQEAQRGEDEGGQAYGYLEGKLAEVPRGSSMDDLWGSLELLYRQATTVAVVARRAGQQGASFAFIHSAHMLARALQPQLSDNEIESQVMASLKKREQEQE